MKAKVRSTDGDIDFIDVATGILRGDMLTPYLFIICLDYVTERQRIFIKKNGFTWNEKQQADDIKQKLWQMLTTPMILRFLQIQTVSHLQSLELRVEI